MPETIHVRDVDDDVSAALTRHAADAGLSVPGLLRRQAARLASRPSVSEWLGRTRRRGGTQVTRAEVLAALDETRGAWPDADR